MKKRLLIIGLVVLWMMSLCGCRHDMRIPTGLWYCAELDLTIWVPESWQESKIQNYDFPEDMVNNVAWVQNDRVQRLSATYSPTGPFLSSLHTVNVSEVTEEDCVELNLRITGEIGEMSDDRFVWNAVVLQEFQGFLGSVGEGQDYVFERVSDEYTVDENGDLIPYGYTTMPTFPFEPATTPLTMPTSFRFTFDYERPINWEILVKNGHTLQFVCDDKVMKEVVLSEPQVQELNALYASVTDFSNAPMAFSNVPTEMEEKHDVVLIVDGNEYRIDSLCTTQVELEQYIRLLKSYYYGVPYNWAVCQHEGHERWNERSLSAAYLDLYLWELYSQTTAITDLIPKDNLDEIEAFDGNVYQYFARFGMDYVRKDGDRYYACYRSEDEVLTVFFDLQGTKTETARSAL